MLDALERVEGFDVDAVRGYVNVVWTVYVYCGAQGESDEEGRFWCGLAE